MLDAGLMDYVSAIDCEVAAVGDPFDFVDTAVVRSWGGVVVGGGGGVRGSVDKCYGSKPIGMPHLLPWPPAPLLRGGPPFLPSSLPPSSVTLQTRRRPPPPR